MKKYSVIVFILIIFISFPGPSIFSSDRGGKDYLQAIAKEFSRKISNRRLYFFCPRDSSQMNYHIYQTDIAFEIDGSLEEWNGIKPFLVLYKPDGEKIQASDDISVQARFAFDLYHFYGGISVQDDAFEFPQRSWRYGDGFYLTFVSNTSGEPDFQFYSYGFSQVGNRLEKILVNRDGTYFPPMDMKEVGFAVKIDSQKHLIFYEVAIPWKYVAPFKPLIHKVLGINLIYVDRDRNKRSILQLFPDPHFDTELSNKRRGAPFIFVERVLTNKGAIEAQSSISTSHCFSDEKLEAQFAVNAQEDKQNCIVRTAILRKGTTVRKIEKKIDISSGMNRFSLAVDLKGMSTGTYQVKNELSYDKGEHPWLVDNEKIYVLNRKWLDTLGDNFKIFNKSAKTAEVYRASIPIAEIRYQWIHDFMNKATSHADIDELSRWVKELQRLYDKLANGQPALFNGAGIHRFAHCSQIDGTLQPYSLYWPPSIEQDDTYPLIVALHGSGVDEKRVIRYYSKIFPDWLIIAPQARGLSDWYLGKSGEDVLECIDHVSRLFPVDRTNIFLIGFSMGGYGVWRIGLLHPEKFRALVIVSGSFKPPPFKKSENMLNFLERARGKSILIVHGALDNAIPVAQIHPGITRLKEMDIDFDYWEIKDAAHGNFKPEVWQRIKEWIRNKYNSLRAVHKTSAGDKKGKTAN